MPRGALPREVGTRHTRAVVAPAAGPFAELAVVTRSGLVESRHFGTLVALRPDGSTAVALGTPDAPVLPRSTAKPFQAVALLAIETPLEGPELAIAAGSHTGEDEHVRVVRTLLDRAGLDEDALGCPPDRPEDLATYERLVREGTPTARIRMNCSGKHAAMLATCVVNGWDTATYRDPEHPLQQAISQTLSELTGDEITAVAVDGCGAPVMAVTLAGLARAFGRMAAAEPGTHEAEVADAIRANPTYLGGTGRDVTALIEATPGLIAKDGAESVYAVGLADGRGVAVKVADGYPRAKPVILAAALRRIGVESPALAQLEHSPVLGHGEPVGAIVAVNL